MLLLLAACETTSVTTTTVCALEQPTLSVAEAAPGDRIVATTTPLTETWDTAVTVGNARAVVLDVDRSTCDDCDDCRDTGGCSTCDECEECATPCDECVETVSFLVPQLDPGTYPIEILNRHGRSQAADLVVIARTFPTPK